MKGNRAALAAVLAIVLLAAGWWLFKRGSAGVGVDLLSRFDQAIKMPKAELFTLAEVELNGERKRAIAVAPDAGSRLTWRVQVPDDAWLRADLALKPEAWDKEGDGVLFLIGVSDGRSYESLVTQHVNPFNTKGDRRWIPVWVDISAYAGEEVDLILNTRSGPAGKEGDTRNDLALWGAPEVVIR
jgi:hypothetical protein